MNFVDRLLKKAQISSFIKIRLEGAELFHADGRADGQTETETDMTKLKVAFRNSANAPKSATFENYTCNFAQTCILQQKICNIIGVMLLS